MSKIDLKSLKENIDKRKKELSGNQLVLGEQVKTKKSKDLFLRELLHSSKTGQETESSIQVKNVHKLAESKVKGEKLDPSVLDHINSSGSKPNINTNYQENNYQGRTAAMDAKLEEQKRMQEEQNHQQYKTSNAGLGELIQQYYNTSTVGSTMSSGMLTEEQMLEKLNQQGYKQNQNNSSSNMLNEHVVNMTNKLLNENFGMLFGEAMKNSIIETYKREVVKAAIDENKDYIKEIVMETIRDLQKRASKAK